MPRLSEALPDATSMNQSELAFVMEWVLRRVKETIESVSQADPEVLMIFALEVANLKARWGENWWEPSREKLEKEGLPALRDAVLAVLAQRGDGWYSAMRTFSGSPAQLLLVDAISRLVAVVGGVAVAVEYYRRAKKHELGFDAAVVLAGQKGLQPRGVEDSYHRLLAASASIFLKMGKGFWEPEFVRRRAKGGQSGDAVEVLDAAKMDLNSQVAITLDERFAKKGDAFDMYVLALEGKLDIVPRAVASDLLDQRRHRQQMREKTPLAKDEEEIRIHFEERPSEGDISQPLREFLQQNPHHEADLAILLSPESRDEVARRLGVTSKTVTNRRKRVEKALREHLKK